MKTEKPDNVEPDIFAGDPFDPEFVEAVQTKEKANAGRGDADVLAYIARRANAYKAVFRPGSRTQDDIDIVLTDLMVFCRAMQAPWDDNSRKQDALVGRSEVFYRIKSQTRLDADTLFLMLTDAKTRT
jgi:hypothetical protein